jgi:hypothetical protein
LLEKEWNRCRWAFRLSDIDDSDLPSAEEVGDVAEVEEGGDVVADWLEDVPEETEEVACDDDDEKEEEEVCELGIERLACGTRWTCVEEGDKVDTCHPSSRDVEDDKSGGDVDKEEEEEEDNPAGSEDDLLVIRGCNSSPSVCSKRKGARKTASEGGAWRTSSTRPPLVSWYWLSSLSSAHASDGGDCRSLSSSWVKTLVAAGLRNEKEKARTDEVASSFAPMDHGDVDADAK